MLYGLGYRYRLHRKNLPGHPDIIFPKLKKAIFVHGCFWHQHSARSCKIARLPKSRLEYWIPKLERNTQRDNAAVASLRELGWTTLVIWECEISNEALLKEAMTRFLAA
jgi:DNA mismatch endonuclease (patch repair protein)